MIHNYLDSVINIERIIDDYANKTEHFEIGISYKKDSPELEDAEILGAFDSKDEADSVLSDVIKNAKGYQVKCTNKGRLWFFRLIKDSTENYIIYIR